MIGTNDPSCLANIDTTGLLFKSARKRSHISEEESKDNNLLSKEVLSKAKTGLPFLSVH